MICLHISFHYLCSTIFFLTCSFLTQFSQTRSFSTLFQTLKKTLDNDVTWHQIACYFSELVSEFQTDSFEMIGKVSLNSTFRKLSPKRSPQFKAPALKFIILDRAMQKLALNFSAYQNKSYLVHKCDSKCVNGTTKLK